MEEKRHIDRIRESSGSAQIGSEEDGAIIEMKTFGDRLLIIKERAIYEMIFADAIDPDRTNIHLPPTIQKLIIDKGTESETVARTFLTAKALFQEEYISNAVDCDIVISLTIDMLSEISILEKEINDYQENENKVSNEYEERRNQKGSYQIPSIVNLESRCKTILQKADHIEQILMDIITRFYPNEGLTKQSHFPKFHEILKTKYGEDDTFTKFVGSTLYYMKIIRELRNGFEHRLDSIKVTDFVLQPDGNVIPPTIELNFRDVRLEKISLSEFLKITIVNHLDIIEMTFAHLAQKNTRTGGMPYQVKLIPENKRTHKFVKHSFWIPIGNEGFYCQ